MKVCALVLSSALVAGSVGAVHGQSSADLNTQTTAMNNLATSSGENNVVGKISGDFSSFLGSDANAVVTGLRNGTPITLKNPSTTTGGLPPPTTSNTIITPPTGQIGHGNVYITLALAKQQLGALGISQPTPSQLQAALTGGTISQTTGTGATATTTNLDGILTLRSQNLGWGQIAQKLGYKLGPVMSAMKSANQHLASQSAPSDGTIAAQPSSKSGIVSAGGQVHGNGGHGNSTGKGSGSGIVTASGRAGNAAGRGAGIVTSAGRSAGVGGGNGVGQGKGHSK